MCAMRHLLPCEDNLNFILTIETSNTSKKLIEKDTNQINFKRVNYT